MELSAARPKAAVDPNPKLLKANIDGLREKLPPKVRVAVVVKNVPDVKPYIGHLSSADYLALPNFAEAKQARAVAPDTPIMVLYNSDPTHAAAMRDLGLEPAASSLQWVEAALASLQAAGGAAAAGKDGEGGKRLRVHLWVDTGMGREGVPPAEAIAIAMRLAEPALSDLFELRGVATHFCCIGYGGHPHSIATLKAAIGPSADAFFGKFDHGRMTMAQHTRYEYVLAQLSARGLLPPTVIKHAAASGAVEQGLSHLYYDMVRVGRMVVEEANTWSSPQLARAHTHAVPGQKSRRFTLRIAQLKQLPAPVPTSLALASASFGELPPPLPNSEAAEGTALVETASTATSTDGPAALIHAASAEAEAEAEAEVESAAEADAEAAEEDAGADADADAESEKTADLAAAGTWGAQSAQDTAGRAYGHTNAEQSAADSAGFSLMDSHFGWCVGYACRPLPHIQSLQGYVCPAGFSAAGQEAAPVSLTVPVAVLEEELELLTDDVVSYRGVRLPVLLAHGYLTVVDLSPLAPDVRAELREGELVELGPDGKGIEITLIPKA